jgi:hypothetical protein
MRSCALTLPSSGPPPAWPASLLLFMFRCAGQAGGGRSCQTLGRTKTNLESLIFAQNTESVGLRCNAPRSVQRLHNPRHMNPQVEPESRNWLAPEQLLKWHWRVMRREELAMHLRRILVAEHRCRSGQSARHLAARCRWRRVAVAKRLAAIGGFVHPLVFAHSIPRGWSWKYPVNPQPSVPLVHRWPGAIALVPYEQAVKSAA